MGRWSSCFAVVKLIKNTVFRGGEITAKNSIAPMQCVGIIGCLGESSDIKNRTSFLMVCSIDARVQGILSYEAKAWLFLEWK